MKLVKGIDDLVPVKTVLASVFYKDNLETLATGLVEHCPEVMIISTGGTLGRLRECLGSDADDYVVGIEKYTGDPEIAGGLVKTLGYAKSLGLLTNTYWPEHQQALHERGWSPIDAVVCNIYPFQQVTQEEGCTPEEARSNMDIGGPTMLNEATKNMIRVVALTSPEQYDDFLKQLKDHGGATTLDFRLQCAKHAMWTLAQEAKARTEYWNGVQADELLGCYEVKNSSR